jgi:hypothetical protein
MEWNILLLGMSYGNTLNNICLHIGYMLLGIALGKTL